MVSRLLSIFGIASGGAPNRRAAHEIESLQRRLRTAAPESRAHLYNRIGDLFVRSGDTGQALSHYGNSLDAYLETGYFDAAAAMCRKMIEAAPDVVRARCTLAFLTLGKGLRQDAITQITDYVNAAQRRGQEELAIERLRLMAEATDDHEIRLLLGEQLAELGDAESAENVLGAVYAERNDPGVMPSLEEQRERWARSLRVAITNPLAGGESQLSRAAVAGKPDGSTRHLELLTGNT